MRLETAGCSGIAGEGKVWLKAAMPVWEVPLG